VRVLSENAGQAEYSTVGVATAEQLDETAASGRRFSGTDCRKSWVRDRDLTAARNARVLDVALVPVKGQRTEVAQFEDG
jgi:hypothetical protein